ncbi:MAG: hypothetical protein LC804_26170, partial [Acidobacteria bacterium]|nr:hypothetical protein [Acidobacteriota bacterium]
MAARVALANGLSSDAEYHRQEMFRYNFPGWIVTDVSSLVVSAKVLASQGRRPESRETIADALTRARQADSPLAIFMAMFAQCELGLAEGSGVDSARLAECLRLGAAHEILNCYSWDRQGLERVCEEALRAGVEPRYALSLISAHRLRP